MFASLAEAAMSLDIGTLFVIAICVTSLLGLFLLFAWLQDGITALAWWGIGVSDRRIFRRAVAPGRPDLAAGAVEHSPTSCCSSRSAWCGAPRACSTAGRCCGARCASAPCVWLAFCSSSAFVTTETSRLVVSSLIVATYTFLTAVELWRERRKSLIRRWPAIFVPMLHGVDLPVSGGAGGTFARRHRQPHAGRRLGRGLCHRGRALRGRRRLHRAGAGQGPHGAANTNWRPRPIR